VNVALVAPFAIVTDDGTVTFAVLLASNTARPPVGAASVNVTVQLSVSAPVTDPLAHVSPASAVLPSAAELSRSMV
jgi:hypothetical protein